MSKIVILLIFIGSLFHDRIIQYNDYYEQINTTRKLWYILKKQGLTIQFVEGSKMLRLLDQEVCQDIPLTFKGKFRINFKYIKIIQKSNVILKVNNKRVENILPNSDNTYSTVQQLDRDVNSLCVYSEKGTYVDNVTVELDKYIEQVTYKVSRSKESYNSIRFEVQFHDHFQEEYWRNYDLRQKIELTINLKKINISSYQELSKNAIEFDIPLEQTLNQNSHVSLAFKNESMKLKNDALILFTQKLKGKVREFEYYSEDFITLKQSAEYLKLFYVLSVARDFMNSQSTKISFFLIFLLYCDIQRVMSDIQSIFDYIKYFLQLVFEDQKSAITRQIQKGAKKLNLQCGQPTSNRWKMVDYSTQMMRSGKKNFLTKLESEDGDFCVFFGPFEKPNDKNRSIYFLR